MAEKKHLGSLAGTPWHIGYVTKDEDDPRRDKRKCLYYTDGYCSDRFGQCVGSSHCTRYKCREEELKKEKNKQESVGWQGKVRLVSLPGIVQRGDTVVVYCKQRDFQRDFVIPNGDDDELAPVHKLCLGKKLNDQFEFNGFEYRILSLKKAKIPKETQKEDGEKILYSKKIKKISYEDVVFFSLAEKEAKGEPGEIILVTERNRTVRWYKFNTEKDSMEKLSSHFPPVKALNYTCYGKENIIPTGWKHINLGFGNHLLVRDDIYPAFQREVKEIYAKNEGNIYSNWKRIAQFLLTGERL